MSAAAIKPWRHIFGGQRGRLCIFSGRRIEDAELEDTKSRYFAFPRQVGAAARYAEEESTAGRETYFCAHLLRGCRRVKENAGEVVALWGELDGAKVPNGNLQPTALVESSPGHYHAYWRLTEAVAPEVAEQLNRRLARQIGADPSGFDLTQLLRVPGTVNHKYPDRPVVNLLDIRPGLAYAPADLDELLPPLSRNGHRDHDEKDSAGEPPVVLDAEGMKVWRGEKPKLKADGAIDRSASLVKIGRALYDAGANRAVILDALWERDAALGWRCYTDRPDANIRYQDVVNELEKNGRNPRITFGEKAEETDSPKEEHRPGEVPEGEDLLGRIARYLQRYVVLSAEQADVLALWVEHTHALEACDTTPYLEVTSAEKRSGKTRLLEVLNTVTARPWLTGRVTAAVLVRKVADLTPTLLLDESDAAFKGDKEYAEALRGILNAGFRRGGVASLCVGQGAKLTYEDFPIFGPKAIAGIGKLPDTISDRAIKIELRRRARSEPVERFRLRKVGPEAAPLRVGAAAWAEAHVGHLEGLEPELPDELDDRAQEICEPLLAVAEVVGGDWPERARRAVIALAGASAREDSDSLGIRLLRDIRAVFDEKKAERVPTGKLLEALHAAEEAPWGSLRGESLDARTLARMLKPYDIKPEKLREGEHTFRGYRRASFEDAWTRYTPAVPEEAEHPEHPEHAANNAGSHVPDKQNVPEHGGHAEHKKPHKTGDVPRVPDVPGNPGARFSDDGDGTADDSRPDSALAAFLAGPPAWYTRQAEECTRKGAPERLLKPLASAVAYHVFGNTNRWSEVLPHVETALKGSKR